MLAWLTDNSGTQCSQFFSISALQWSWLKIYSSGVRIEYPMYTRWGVHYWRPGAVVPWRWQGSDRWAAGDWQAQVCVRGSSLLHLSQHNIGIQDQEQEQERNIEGEQPFHQGPAPSNWALCWHPEFQKQETEKCRITLKPREVRLGVFFTSLPHVSGKIDQTLTKSTQAVISSKIV